MKIMPTSVNIVAIFIIILLFQSTFASDDNLWFPKEFPMNKLVKCGLEHEMYGLSIVNDHIFQFEKCSVIIYPPPLNQYFIENFNQLNLENGYRFTFDEIQPNWRPNYCQYAKQSINIPQYSLIRLKISNNKHGYDILLYFTGQFHKNQSNQYYLYDFNQNLHLESKRKFYRNSVHYLLITDGYEQFILQNELQDDQYEIINDGLIQMNNTMGKVCILNRDNDGSSNNYFIIKRQSNKQCDEKIRTLTRSLLKTIHLSFTLNGDIYLLSLQDNLLLIIEPKFLQSENIGKDFILQKKLLSNFLICKSKPSIKLPTVQPSIITTTISKITTTTTAKELNFFENFLNIILLIIIIISCMFCGIFICFKCNKKSNKYIVSQRKTTKLSHKESLLSRSSLSSSSGIEEKKSESVNETIRSDIGTKSNSTEKTN